DVLDIYARRCNAMVESVEKYFPAGEMTHPQGGFFVWWEAPEEAHFNAKGFNEAVAIPNDILYVPSEAFYPVKGWKVDEQARDLIPVSPRKNGMRLSFSAVQVPQIVEGIEKLGHLLKMHLDR
ncbi:MAG TPA: hypothetical protein PLG66_07480, partial [Calditrichia bacterium]|nr:hypothetical protein [Calditrichia bacterium]